MEGTLKENIDILKQIAEVTGWRLNRVDEYQKTVLVYEYIDFKLKRELIKLNIKTI